MSLQMLGDDFIEQAVHRSANGRDTMQNIAALGLLLQRSLDSVNLPGNATDARNQIGIRFRKMSHVPSLL